MRASFLFINKSFWKSPLNILFAFVVPTIFLCAACGAWSIFNGQISPVLMFPTISYISIVFIGLLVLPAIIFTYRKANILRRIEDSGNKKTSFVFAMCLFFTLLFVLTYSVNCGLCTLILIKNRQMDVMWRTANYPCILYALIVVILMTTSIGIVLGMNAKSMIFIQTFGVSVTLISAFMAFWIAPIQLIGAEPGRNPMMIISLCWPYRYISNMFAESWLQTYSFNLFHSNPFDFTTSYCSWIFPIFPDQNIYDFMVITTTTVKILNLLVPYSLIMLVFAFQYLMWKYKPQQERD